MQRSLLSSRLKEKRVTVKPVDHKSLGFFIDLKREPITAQNECCIRPKMLAFLIIWLSTILHLLLVILRTNFKQAANLGP